MAVYVDDMHLTDLGRLGRMKMCHMIADSDEELHAMADRIGVERKHHQAAGTARSHYDIAKSKRALAVAAGAIQITMRQSASMCAYRRVHGRLTSPEEALAWRRGIAAQEAR